MASFRIPMVVLFLVAGATSKAMALDQQALGLRANCQTLLAGISASPYSTQELAAFCRARAPSGICHDALSSLGQKPWAPTQVSETCGRWEQDLEQRMLEMSPERSAEIGQDLQRSLQQKDQAGTCASGKPLEQCATDKATNSPGATDKLQTSMQDKTMPPGPVIGSGSPSEGKNGLGSIEMSDKSVEIPQATTAAPDATPIGTALAESSSGPSSPGDATTIPGDAVVTTTGAGSDARTTVEDGGATSVAGTIAATSGTSDATTMVVSGKDNARMTGGAASTSTDAAGTTTASDATATVPEATEGGSLGQIGGRGTKDAGGTEDAAEKSFDGPKKASPIKLDDAEVKVEFHKKISLQQTGTAAGLILTGLVAMAVVAGVAALAVRNRRPIRAHHPSRLYARSSDLEDQEEQNHDLLLH